MSSHDEGQRESGSVGDDDAAAVARTRPVSSTDERPEAGPKLRPVARVNIDGVEGSSIPGGVHLARYGGGDDYAQVEPLVSAWRGTDGVAVGGAGDDGDAAESPTSTTAWKLACERLPQVTPQSLQLLHGFSTAALLPSGVAPTPESLTVEPACHLLVSRLPLPLAGGSSHHASLMLHGWLFPDYHASGRKAHQKFPLFSITATANIAVPTEPTPPQWLRVDGQFSYADQHVHKDEPIDFGDGFIFCEVFFGSDMARVAALDPTAPCSLWMVAVDVETSRALVAFCVLLPPSDGSEMDKVLIVRFVRPRPVVKLPRW
eukprot:SAG31_NODE_5732_length_2354_cov_6.233703_1_plen_317_part_00